MALRTVDGDAGHPWWPRALRGSLEQLVVESEVLAGNPLGDSARRPLYVYLPPGVERTATERYPTVYLIQGYTGQIDMWVNRKPFEPNMIERLDTLFSSGDVPPAVVVLVDAWTSIGGSQFINSVATGRYMDYLCDEVVPFIDAHYPVVRERERRGLTGHSSGGYGAMVVPMLRPDVFGALASHAGDAMFEYCYAREFPAVIRALRDDFESSWDVFFERMKAAPAFDFGKFGDPIEIYAMAAAYSPDENDPPRVLFPFDLHSGRMIEEVWQRWLAWDPVRMAPQHMEALASMSLIYLDAGRSDEWFLDVGAQAFAHELDKGGVRYQFELFDGKHGGMQHRYPIAVRALAQALSR